MISYVSFEFKWSLHLYLFEIDRFAYYTCACYHVIACVHLVMVDSLVQMRLLYFFVFLTLKTHRAFFVMTLF